ncbi:MAG: hydrogenase maturation protease [Nitrososphaerota archaeon]
MENLEWIKYVESILENCDEENPLHVFGYGNVLRRDDGVGLYIISNLLKTIKEKPKYIHIHPASTVIERKLNKIPKSSKILVIDAVKVEGAPGAIIFTEFKKVESYILDTHNISLKFILEAKSQLENSYLLGIIPEDTSIGEELTPVVRQSADEIVTHLRSILTKFSKLKK